MDAGMEAFDRTVLDQEIKIPSRAKQSTEAESILNRLIINIKEKLIYKIAAGFVFFLFLLIIFMMLVPAEDPYWEELVVYYEQGQYDEALKIAQQVLVSDPNNERYLDAVEKIREKLSKKETVNLEDVVLLTESDKPEKVKEAATKLEKMFAQDSDNKQVEKYLLEAQEKAKILDNISLASENLEADRFDDCLDKLKIVLANYPKNELAIQYRIEAHMKKAQKFENQKNWRSALQEWDLVLADSPENEIARLGKKLAQSKFASAPVRSTTKPRTNRAPKINKLLVGKTELAANENTWIKANASDPDGENLIYNWSATYGRIQGSGSQVKYYAPASIKEDLADKIVLIVKDTRNKSSTKVYSILLKKPAIRLSQKQKERAKELYYQAYREENDYQNLSRARDLYQQVMALTPDPNFEFYKKAENRLKKLKK